MLYFKTRKLGENCNFFLKIFGNSKIIFIFAPCKACSRVDGLQKIILWKETSGQLYGQSRETFS